MNVKPGDLAICIRGLNSGVLVHADELYGMCRLVPLWNCTTLSTSRSSGMIDREGRPVCYYGDIKTLPPGSKHVFPDTYLRPLPPPEDVQDYDSYKPDHVELLTCNETP